MIIDHWGGQSQQASSKEVVGEEVEETGKIMVHYEPDHRDADWAGYVAISSRKHVQPNHGDDDKDEWKPSKRQLNNKSSGSTLDLIGGPDDPSTLDPRNWQSEAQAAAVRSKTSVDQLTDRGRSQIQIRYSNRQLGKQESADSVAANLSGEDPFRYLLNETTSSSPRRGEENNNFVPLCEDPQFSLIGYRHTQKNPLLSGLGKHIFTDSPSLVEKANVNLS